MSEANMVGTSVEVLESVCDEIVNDSDLAPEIAEDGTVIATHCNAGAARVAAAMGCMDLDGLMADQQFTKMADTPGWVQGSAEAAVAHARAGGLAFAAVVEHPHGHIAAIRPEPMERSDTWGEDVPIIANVGHENKRCKLSGGFKLAQRSAIRFFLWSPV